VRTKAAALSLSLFWRTFFLLALLLAGGVFAWVQTLRALEFEPRAVQAAQQTAGLVNLSRAALRQADGINRVALVKSMGSQQAMRVAPREPGDRWEPFEVDRFTPPRQARNCAPRWGPTPWWPAASTAARHVGGLHDRPRPLLAAGRGASHGNAAVRQHLVRLDRHRACWPR
jgi:hypothetical protein